MAITDWPIHLRPREKLLHSGANSLSDAELLAIFLQTGRKGKTAVDLAVELLTEFKTLNKLLSSTRHQITLKGLGQAKFTMLQAAVELGRRCLAEKMRQERFLTSAQEAKKYLISKLSHYKHEVFACIFLNARHQFIDYKELFHGTINCTPIYTRVIAQTALELNAGAVIFAHNHPSGDPLPSQNDIETTKEIATVLAVLDIKVLDHIVVGGNTSTSLCEKGLLSFS
jgi:DNA repair protein RadC